MAARVPLEGVQADYRKTIREAKEFLGNPIINAGDSVTFVVWGKANKDGALAQANTHNIALKEGFSDVPFTTSREAFPYTRFDVNATHGKHEPKKQGNPGTVVIINGKTHPDHGTKLVLRITSFWRRRLNNADIKIAIYQTHPPGWKIDGHTLAQWMENQEKDIRTLALDFATPRVRDTVNESGGYWKWVRAGRDSRMEVWLKYDSDMTYSFSTNTILTRGITGSFGRILLQTHTACSTIAETSFRSRRSSAGATQTSKLFISIAITVCVTDTIMQRGEGVPRLHRIFVRRDMRGCVQLQVPRSGRRREREVQRELFVVVHRQRQHQREASSLEVSTRSPVQRWWSSVEGVAGKRSGSVSGDPEKRREAQVEE